MTTRTPSQQASLEIYCRTMAEQLNNSDMDVKKFLDKVEYKLDVPWTQKLFKDIIFKPILESQTGKESTTDMDTVEPGEIHRIVDKYMAEKTGCSAAWPSRFDVAEQK